MGRVMYFAYHKLDINFEPPNLIALNLQNGSNDKIINDVNDLKFKYIGEVKIENRIYQKYFCKFFIHKKKIVYIDGSMLKGYEVPYEFYAYKIENSSIIFFDVKTSIGKKYIYTVNKRANKEIFEEYNFNLEEVLKKVLTVNLAWFRMDDSVRISSQALSGRNIKNTPEFNELSSHSIKSSIEIEYQYKDIVVYPYISKRNSIFLRASIEPKDIEINIIYQIFVDLIL